MIHLRDQLSFSLEALLGLRTQERWRNELDCDVAVEKRIVRAIYNAHASAAQLGCNFISV
jgi:hypothetical protein